jgi:hypothetical protein
MSTAADALMTSFLAEIVGHDHDVDRLVLQPSGLDAAGIVAALEHPVLFDDGHGGTTLDEWEMIAAIGTSACRCRAE